MSTRLLRAAVSDEQIGLSRGTAVVSDDPALEDVLVGADGVRLHEEVLYAGGWAPETSRFRRLENLGVLGGILDRALSTGTPVSAPVWQRTAPRSPTMRRTRCSVASRRSGPRRNARSIGRTAKPGTTG